MLLLNIKQILKLHRVIRKSRYIPNERSFQDEENDTKMNIGPWFCF